MNYEKEEKKKTMAFESAWKGIKYLRKNLSKEVKDPYAEKYITTIKETADDTKKWKDIMDWKDTVK